MKTLYNIELTDEQLENIAEKVSLKLVKKQDEEFSKLKAYAFHNTRLLLRNYNKLELHIQTVEDQILEDGEMFWNHKFLTLNSLMQNRAKTVKIMKHVDKCLEEYRQQCIKENSRGYKLLEKKYLQAKLSDEAIASFYDVDRSTINKRTKEAINEFSILLYGVDALDIK